MVFAVRFVLTTPYGDGYQGAFERRVTASESRLSMTHPGIPETFEAVIGLECHAQLNTKSKMFCPCSTAYTGAQPNTHVCPVCFGIPGVLPVINAQAVEYGIMTGLALNCDISERSKFNRKNYHYADLM